MVRDSSLGYIEVSHLPLILQLEQNWEKIRDEADNLIRMEKAPLKINGSIGDQEGRYSDQAGKPKYLGKNVTVGLKVVPQLLDRTEDHILNPVAEQRREYRQKFCPVTMSCFSPFWDQIGNIHFNELHPGAHITAHYGTLGSKEFVRVHLGLRTPPGVTFHIEGYPDYHWQEGKCMGFDDYGSLHWVTNNGTSPRLILCVDINKSLLKF